LPGDGSDAKLRDPVLHTDLDRAGSRKLQDMKQLMHFQNNFGSQGGPIPHCLTERHCPNAACGPN
jgi:hypothetical protein